MFLNPALQHESSTERAWHARPNSYGSSWHAGDAGFIGFLGKYGYKILLLGSSFVIIGFCYLLWTKRHYFPLSPRPRKVLLEPFELVSHTHSPLFNKESSKIDGTCRHWPAEPNCS